MSTDSPTEMLEAEHRVIAKVIGAVPVVADKLEAGQPVDVETLRNIVEFMRTFADKCHHGTEHTRGRALVKELADAADVYQKGDLGGKEALVKGLRGIVALYPNHIWKEDYLLFPLTNKVLSPEEQQNLYKEFEKVEERIGRDTHHRLEEFAEHLAQATQIG
jgi:hemerythrin-like domain-containing protein